MTFLVKGKF